MPSARSSAIPAPKEWQEQAELVRWKRLVQGREKRLKLLWHTPNGEVREPRTAAKLQAMGVEPHIPDLFLAVPARHFYDEGARWEQWHGCFIEMKRLTGSAGQEQRAFHEELRAQGYNVVVMQGWLAAARHLCWYLHRPDLAKELED